MSTMIQNSTPEFDPGSPVEFTTTQVASRTALELVVASFNPSQDGEVGKIKLWAAALITKCEQLRDAPLLDEGEEGAPNTANIDYNKALQRRKRWAATAITHFETAAMFLVKAETAIKKS